MQGRSFERRQERSPETAQERELRIVQEREVALEKSRRLEILRTRYAKLERKLTHPEFPEALRGLPGIIKGHELLKQFEVAGVLIGGLAEEILKQGTTETDLAKHKDTDILILDLDQDLEDTPPTKFYGGIDWWSHMFGNGKGKPEKRWHYWQNGNGTVLNFRIEISGRFEPGLHIPDSSLVREMRTQSLRHLLQRKGVKNDESERQVKEYVEVLNERMPYSNDLPLVNKLCSENGIENVSNSLRWLRAQPTDFE